LLTLEPEIWKAACSHTVRVDGRCLTCTCH
jgi:hypothetical protein